MVQYDIQGQSFMQGRTLEKEKVHQTYAKADVGDPVERKI